MSSSADAHKILQPQALALVSNYALLAQLVVDGFFFGLHRGPRQAYSLEYNRHRPYDAGDPLKRIDWKLFAKTDHLYVKQFEEDTNLEAWILMDASRSMNYRGSRGAVSKWQYASYLAAALAHLLTEQHDAVGLMLFDGVLKTVIPPRVSRLQLHRILKEFHVHQASGRATSFEKSAAIAAARMKHRGLVLYFSDFLGEPEEIERAFKLLLAGGHELMVFHVLTPDEIDFPFDRLSYFEDMETEERILLDPASFRQDYAKALGAYLARMKQIAGRLQMTYRQVTTSESLEQSLHAFLSLRERVGR